VAAVKPFVQIEKSFVFANRWVYWLFQRNPRFPISNRISLSQFDRFVVLNGLSGTTASLHRNSSWRYCCPDFQFWSPCQDQWNRFEVDGMYLWAWWVVGGGSFCCCCCNFCCWQFILLAFHLFQGDIPHALLSFISPLSFAPGLGFRIPPPSCIYLCSLNGGSSPPPIHENCNREKSSILSLSQEDVS
jgi:hypothetical protein